MKLFCTDGTTIECTTFRALDSGVLIFQDEEPQDDPGHEEADGFVPITQLQYVLPDGVQPGAALGGAQQMPAGPATGGQQGSGQFGGPQQGQGGAGLRSAPGGGAGGPSSGRTGGQSGGPQGGRGSSQGRRGSR